MSKIFKIIDRITLKLKGVDLDMVDKEHDIMKAKIEKQKELIKAAQESIKQK